jgi:Spy/CpxP family protein refolding chaperone
MKKMFRNRIAAALAVLGVLFGAWFTALGQPSRDTGPGRPVPPPGAEGGERLAPGGGPGQFGPAFGRIFGILTDDQRVSLRQAFEDQRDKARELEEHLRAAREELLNAGLASKFDEELIRQKAMAAARIEAELTVLRAKSLSKIRPPLTPEQVQKLKAPPAPGAEEAPGAPSRGRSPVPARDEHGLPIKPAPLPQPPAKPTQPQ